MRGGDDSAGPSVLTWSFDGAIVSMFGRPRWLAILRKGSLDTLSTVASISDEDYDLVDESMFKSCTSSNSCESKKARRVLRIPRGATVVAKNSFGECRAIENESVYANAYSVL